MNKIWLRHGTEYKEGNANLICFPYAGGSPAIFANWIKEFGDDINLCPVLYPGRDLRFGEDIPSDIKAIVKEFVLDNEKLFNEDFVLLGYCAGGLFAYETMIQIKEIYGKTPKSFISISFATPKFKMTLEDICNSVDDNELINYLLESRIIDEESAKNEDFLEYYLSIIKADLQAVVAYEYGDVRDIDCDIYGSFGKEDTMFNEEEKKYWNEYTSKKCELMDIEGGHYCIDDNRDFIISFIKNMFKQEV